KYLGDADNRPSTSAPVNLVVSAPGKPAPKVGSKITAMAPKVIKKGKRAKVKVIVTAPKVTPTGKVRVIVRGKPVKNRVFTVELNRHGKAKVRLPKAKRTGKITVKIVYGGDAAVR